MPSREQLSIQFQTQYAQPHVNVVNVFAPGAQPLATGMIFPHGSGIEQKQQPIPREDAQARIAGGSVLGANRTADPITSGAFGGIVGYSWTGILCWQREREDAWFQVQAVATDGFHDPKFSIWPRDLRIQLVEIAISFLDIQAWMLETNAPVARIKGKPGDSHQFDDLVKLVRSGGSYALAGREEGPQFLLVPLNQDLLCAFSVCGFTSLPKPRRQQPDRTKSRVSSSSHVRSRPGSEPKADSQGALQQPEAQHSLREYSNNNNNGLGQQLIQRPLDAVAQPMFKLFEQPRLIPGGSGTGTSAVAGPTTAGGIGERTRHQWTGTLQWQNDTNVARSQVTAIATKGNPLGRTWPKVLSLSPAQPTVSIDELQDWIKRSNPVVLQIWPASATDNYSYGQLVQLLRTKGCYAVSAWELEGVGWPTVNLLVTVIMQGLLLGAAFPTSGIPELPTPRFPQLNPAAPQVVSNTLPTALRPISTPQLIQGSTQINNLQLVRQQQPLQALNEGGAPLPNVAAIPQQRQPMPQGDVMQMKRLDEHFRHALGNRVPIVGENDVGPSSAGSSGEGMDYWWTGTVMWQGIEMKEARAQITATAFIGNPRASTWPEVLSLAPAGLAVSLDDLRAWIKETNPMVVQIRPALGTNDHNYGQLVKWLKEKGYYAVSGWEIPGKGRPTMNLLIALYEEGPLLGAVFPTTGMRDIPKPRLPPLDPAVHQAIMNVLPPQIQSLPEPQLSQAIRQVYF